MNLPFEGLSDADAAPLIKLAEKLGLFAAQVINGPVNRAEIELWGVEERLTKILSVASLKGLLAPHLAESVNFVNAEQIARDARHRHQLDDASRCRATTRTCSRSARRRATEETCVSGTVFHEKNQRIVSVNNFRVEFKPEGHLIYIINSDVPGVVGKVGTTPRRPRDQHRRIQPRPQRQRRHGHGHHHHRLAARATTPDRAAASYAGAIEEVRQLRV